MIGASTYYFNSNMHGELALGGVEVSLGFKYCLVHFGSIAIGSFVIALIRFIRIVFLYLAKQAEKQSGENPAIKMIVKVGSCILACIEKICDYINESAYAYQAVSGENFCKSAWNGFLLQVKHMAKFAFANLIAKVFIFLGKVGVTAGNMVSCYYVMKHYGNMNPSGEDHVEVIYYPIVFVGVVTFLTASIFLNMFDTAVLSLLTCLAIDIDNNGTPAFGPPTFHDKKDKIEGAGKDVDTYGEMMEGGEHSGEKLFKNSKVQNLL
jgi:choline transporter-like protein 2/4/5